MRDFSIRELAGASEEEVSEINLAIRYCLSWLKGFESPLNCSVGFVIELAWHMVKRHFNVHAIMEEIAILEGRSSRTSQTKRASKFRKPPLAGLWHKHHFQACFMAENILLEINKPGNLDSRLRRFMGRTVGEIVDEMTIEIVDGSLKYRAMGKGLTGEFIVFERDAEGKNRYLTLGRHGDDEQIWKRIESYRLLDDEARRTYSQ